MSGSSIRGQSPVSRWFGPALVALGAGGWWFAMAPVDRPTRSTLGAPVEVAGQAGGEAVAGGGAVDPEKDRRVDEAIRRARLSSVSLQYGSGGPNGVRQVASGVIINDQGDLLSIRVDPPVHPDQQAIIATDARGHRHPALWVAADPDTGLTLLRLPPRAVVPIRLAARDPALGSDVFLIGNPLGLWHTVTRGHIAGLGRRLMLGAQTVPGLIQVQASIYPGDNGALLADLDGGWLGLVRGGLEPIPGVARDNDLAFAIPARDALWVADRLRASGRVDRAYLGLRFAADATLRTLVLAPGGAVAPPDDAVGAKVSEVVPGSPAAQTQLRPGDRVVRIDDRPVLAADDLTDRLERTAAGAEVALEFIRGAARDRVTLKAGSRPTPAPAAAPIPRPRPTAAPAAATPSVPDEPTAALIRSLRDRLDQLERRVRELEGERRPGQQPPAIP